ncbi:MAG: hypothetical protein HYX61_07060 [Gammaproteobacteria bacterium]|nr:hypothetical protein [Gammaproteobacteria bacterium]
MSTHWHLAMLVTGCLIACATMNCHAEQRKNENPVGSLSSKRISHEAVQTKTLHHIFEDMNLKSAQKPEKDKSQAWKQYKETLRSMLAVHFTDSIQIGFDRIKSGPSRAIKGEIVDINSHLSPKTGSDSLTARGYGVQMKVKLD